MSSEARPAIVDRCHPDTATSDRKRDSPSMRDFSTIRSLTAILFSSAPRISTTAVLTNFGGIATGMRRTSRRFSVACTVFVCQTAIQRRATPPFKQYFIHSVLSGHNGRITAIARATFHPRSSSEATATSPTDPTNERRISPPFSRVRWYFPPPGDSPEAHSMYSRTHLQYLSRAQLVRRHHHASPAAQFRTKLPAVPPIPRYSNNSIRQEA